MSFYFIHEGISIGKPYSLTISLYNKLQLHLHFSSTELIFRHNWKDVFWVLNVTYSDLIPTCKHDCVFLEGKLLHPLISCLINTEQSTNDPEPPEKIKTV